MLVTNVWRLPLFLPKPPTVRFIIASLMLWQEPSMLECAFEYHWGNPIVRGGLLHCRRDYQHGPIAAERNPRSDRWQPLVQRQCIEAHPVDVQILFGSSLGQVFEAVIPAGVRSAAGVRIRTMLYPGPLSEEADRVQRLPAKQKAVLEQLKEVGTGVTIDQLQKLASCSAGPIQALRQAGFIEAKQEECMDSSASTVQHRPSMMPPALSVDQRQAMVAIQNAIENGQHQTILLHGVTGSGKTEVYMQAIAQTIANAGKRLYWSRRSA